MLLEALAKELVEVTSGLVGGRTINIMNTDGIIIASTETERIGSFHQGAMEAVQTGKPVIIRKDQLDRYPGAKEGYNMPLRVSGSIIGVVGLFGNPPEIQDLAHLLEVYAAKYYQLEAMFTPRLAESELRDRLLRHLLSHADTSMSSAKAMMEPLQIQLQPPFTVAVLSSRSGAALLRRQEDLVQQLKALQLLHPNRDIWGTVNDRLVLLLSGTDGQPAAMIRKREVLNSRPLCEYRISLGAPCQTLWDVQSAYEQASVLDIISPAPVNDMQQLPTRCSYMLYHTAATEAEFMDGLNRKLETAFHGPELETLLKTIQSYYNCNRSVSQAAAALFIHKNTLQYRVRRLLEALDLTKCTSFQQEYLIRLLLKHRKRRQSLQALQ